MAGRVIETTAEHPFYVRDRGWRNAHELREGDQLNSHTGTWVRVDDVSDTGRVTTVYNFRVAEHHTYFVGCEEWGFSVWAHNAKYEVFADVFGTYSIRYWEGTGSTRTLKLLETPNGNSIRFKTAAEAEEWIARNAAPDTLKKPDDLALPPKSVAPTASGPVKWKVDPTTTAADEAAGVLVNGSYIKNPSAKPLSGLVNQHGKIVDPVNNGLANGKYMYVVDESGNIIIGTRAGQRMPHPTLVGGADPQVRAAGIVEIRGCKIYSVDNGSGHFKPGASSLNEAKDAFGKLDPKVFKDFQGYLDHAGKAVLPP